MKKQLERLNNLAKNGINIDDFYTASITKHEISLQGRVTSDTMCKYRKLFDNLAVEDNGFICGSIVIDGVNVRITLT
jgi:hypothetical protein